MMFTPPREVSVGDAAAFVGTTPQAIGGYHESGLLPERERNRYGHEDIVRLLWIRKMEDAGMAADDIRGEHDVTVGTALLSDFVRSRLASLPEGSLRQADLDTLLVTERIFGPLGAAVQAARFIVLAAQPHLRAESDRVDAAEEALDDAVAVDDPRVAQVAAERHAFELALNAFIEDSGLAQADESLFDAWNTLHPVESEDGELGPMSAAEAVGRMPYDFSPARLRCIELAEQMTAHSSPAPSAGPR